MQSSIINKIHEKSKDEILLDSFLELDILLSKNKIEYIIIGSFAIYSYFDNFHHFPSDIDIAIKSKDFLRFKDILQQENYKIANRMGFCQFYINNVQYHLLVDILPLIDFSNKKIFYKLNLEFEIENLLISEFIFWKTSQKIKFLIPRIEYLFLLELLPPLSTKTMFSLIEILNNCKLDIDLLVSYMLKHFPIIDIFKNRILLFINIINKQQININNSQLETISIRINNCGV